MKCYQGPTPDYDIATREGHPATHLLLFELSCGHDVGEMTGSNRAQPTPVCKSHGSKMVGLSNAITCRLCGTIQVTATHLAKVEAAG